MVMKGQFLERPTLIPVGKEVLEGLSHRGDRPPPLLIVPPPPQEGGGMDHTVAAELAWAGATAGHPTLRFNFRGVGASQGRRGDERDRVADAEAAMRLLEENTGVVSVALAVLGGSARTALALQAKHPAVCGICLISPREVAAADLARLRVPVLMVVGAKDRHPSRVALSVAVTEAGGAVEIVEDADAQFLRNLPVVGKVAVEWLQKLEGR